MAKQSKRPVKPEVKIGALDFTAGFVVALAISDWVIQPQFDNSDASYAMKLLNWLVVSLLFLLIAMVVISLSVYVRGKLKR